MSDRTSAIEGRHPDSDPPPTAIGCPETKEWMPWFVTGALTQEQDALVSAHLSHCIRCQADLIEVLRLRRVVSSEIAQRPAARDESWMRIRAEAFASDITEIDVGTLLLGFQLGIRATHGRSSIDGSLRVFGREVRVLGQPDRRTSAKRSRAASGGCNRLKPQRGADKEEDDV